MATERIILGIDPGTTIMGYALIHEQQQSIKLLCMDALLLAKYENQPLKLKKIFETIIELIDTYKPDELAIEAQFFGKNVQSMLKLGRAQGVAIAAALVRDIPVCEYAPKKIKQSITGNGNASKEQVAAMLRHLIFFKDMPLHMDATDALAIAVCHHLQMGGIKQTQGKSYSGWDQFLKNNPGRVK